MGTGLSFILNELEWSWGTLTNYDCRGVPFLLDILVWIDVTMDLPSIASCPIRIGEVEGFIIPCGNQTSFTLAKFRNVSDAICLVAQSLSWLCRNSHFKRGYFTEFSRCVCQFQPHVGVFAPSSTFCTKLIRNTFRRMLRQKSLFCANICCRNQF